MAFFVYVAFIFQKVQPGVYMGLRTVNDPIPDGERHFMTACMKLAVERGDMPVVVGNLSKPKKKEG